MIENDTLTYNYVATVHSQNWLQRTSNFSRLDILWYLISKQVGWRAPPNALSETIGENKHVRWNLSCGRYILATPF